MAFILRFFSTIGVQGTTVNAKKVEISIVICLLLYIIIYTSICWYDKLYVTYSMLNISSPRQIRAQINLNATSIEFTKWLE